MADSSAQDIAIIGSFSIDSVLTPTGAALPAKPGGNALWSALGARLAGHLPQIVARIGRDYPEAVLDRLAEAGFDLGTLVRLDIDHPVRVSYAHRPDGGRIQPVTPAMVAHLPEADRAAFVDTTSSPEILALGAPRPEDIPAEWLARIGYWHLPLLPLATHRALVATLAAAPGVLQADCPSRGQLVGAPFERLAPTLPALDIFLPSTSDLEVIAPDLTPGAALDAFRAAGAGAMVLKAGADGLFIDDGHRRMRMAAWPGEAHDPTGAGDAFCGGFLAARAAGASLFDAAAMGSAAASFAVATADPLDLLDVDPAEVARRAARLKLTLAPVETPEPATEAQS